MIVILLSGCGAQRQPEPSAQPAQSKEASAGESSAETTSEPPAPSDAAQNEPPPDPSLPAESDAAEESASVTMTITIPEGYTLARIGMLLEEKNLCTTDEFIQLTQTVDVSTYPLLSAQQANEGRCFRLEGYLFPDTYEIFTGESVENVIHRLLSHYEQKIDDTLREQITQSGYTVDEIMTLASIIEKEAFGHDQMPYISSVLHNRLDAGMQLQCDVTITYVEGAIKPFITGDVDRYNGYYNTYKCAALPAGAICNPGMNAIRAALSPADTDYFFFVTDENKDYYYAATWEEHLENVEKAGL